MLSSRQVSRFHAFFLSAAVVAPLLTGAAAAQNATALGDLSCDVSAGVGLLLTQRQTLACTFFSATGAPPERYSGSISEFGIALGVVQAGHLVWGVIAPTSGVPRGALAGTYTGVGANASAVVGVGANALIGGTGRAFSLQPISVQGQVGVNVAAGITSVTLVPAP